MYFAKTFRGWKNCGKWTGKADARARFVRALDASSSGRKSRLAIAARFGRTSRGLSAADRLGRNRNGELLRKVVEGGFDVLITMDSNMVHQQNLAKYPIAVVVLRAASNRLGDTRPLMPALLALLPHIKSGTVTFLPS